MLSDVHAFKKHGWLINDIRSVDLILKNWRKLYCNNSYKI